MKISKPESSILDLQSTVLTTCPYCGVGCGVEVKVGKSIRLIGDKLHPASYGRLCSKGAALADTLEHAGRLLYPQVSGQRASWEVALDRVAEKFKRIIAEHGPDAVAFYVSGQILYRGLLRRQQADERFYRQRQYRYQFAALHVFGSGGPEARLRCRCGAGML